MNVSINGNLNEYVDKDVLIELTHPPRLITGRLHAVTFDFYGSPASLLVRDASERTITIAWHAVATIEHKAAGTW